MEDEIVLQNGNFIIGFNLFEKDQHFVLLKGVNFMIIMNVINHMKIKGSILLPLFFIMGFCDLLVGSTLTLKKKECIQDEQRFLKT